jgi:hypothetical protein
MVREKVARLECQDVAQVPTMLGVFVLAQMILLLGLHKGPPWKAFVGWFIALPLT